MKAESIPEAMDATEHPPLWTSDKFLDMRKEYLDNRTEEKAVDLLKRLVSIDEKEVDANAWLDAKDVICLLLGGIDTKTLLETHQVLLMMVVNQSSPNIVHTLAAHLKNKPGVFSSLHDGAVALAVSFTRRLPEVECSEEVAHLIAPVADKAEVLAELNDQLATAKKNSEHRFRVYNVLLCAWSGGHSSATALSPLLASLTDELKGDDVLVQLAALDLLADAAISNKKAAEALVAAGVTGQVYDMLAHAKDAPDGGFLYPGCVKFFGHLCRCYPDAIKRFPAFLPAVFDQVRHFDLLDASQRVLTFDTLSNVAFSEVAKNVMEESMGWPTVSTALSSLGAAVASGPVELRVRHLDAVSLLFENGPEATLSRWWSALGEPFAHLLHSLCQKPFPELRIAALNVVCRIAGYEFGRQQLLALAGFPEWVCDRDSELDWDASQAKASLVRTLADSASPSVSPSLLVKLNAYFIAPKKAPQVEVL